ncbi:hypothetical protein Q3G72_004972 [Acer saccharum]|nr:hypothetical protein Q3G72_004972 [Acer saccharum]
MMAWRMETNSVSSSSSMETTMETISVNGDLDLHRCLRDERESNRQRKGAPTTTTYAQSSSEERRRRWLGMKRDGRLWFAKPRSARRRITTALWLWRSQEARRRDHRPSCRSIGSDSSLPNTLVPI